MPDWGWWVLALMVILGAVGVPLVVRARRRSTWQAELTACEDEVAWFARVLVPDLRATGSRAGVAGGWAVGGEARVAAVEDRLTVLESTAPDEAAGARARALRDAVRSSRTRVKSMADSGTDETMLHDLDQVVAELEAALPPTPAKPQP